MARKFHVGDKVNLKTGRGDIIRAEIIRVLPEGYYDLTSPDISLPLTLSERSLNSIIVPHYPNGDILKPERRYDEQNVYVSELWASLP